MTILVGYDGSDAAVRALERAASEARRSHRRLVVLAVMDMPLDPRAPRQFGTAGDGSPVTGPFAVPPPIADVLDDARSRLGPDVPADFAWAPGEPARLIVDVAAERGATTIVVGHHHHGMLGRLFGTDVAADVERLADCEVLLVD